mmetsp:Transcript_7738/g.28063  ORF Transcript_7738/g.28063 Transcript_7738/m.28063 type:complete len:280 (+) Transcript_7738:1753-2592(+)
MATLARRSPLVQSLCATRLIRVVVPLHKHMGQGGGVSSWESRWNHVVGRGRARGERGLGRAPPPGSRVDQEAIATASSALAPRGGRSRRRPGRLEEGAAMDRVLRNHGRAPEQNPVGRGPGGRRRELPVPSGRHRHRALRRVRAHGAPMVLHQGKDLPQSQAGGGCRGLLRRRSRARRQAGDPVVLRLPPRLHLRRVRPRRLSRRSMRLPPRLCGYLGTPRPGRCDGPHVQHHGGARPRQLHPEPPGVPRARGVHLPARNNAVSRPAAAGRGRCHPRLR